MLGERPATIAAEIGTAGRDQLPGWLAPRPTSVRYGSNQVNMPKKHLVLLRDVVDDPGTVNSGIVFLENNDYPRACDVDSSSDTTTIAVTLNNSSISQENCK